MYGLMRICRDTGEKVLIIASDTENVALTDLDDVITQKAAMEDSWGDEYTFEILAYVG